MKDIIRTTLFAMIVATAGNIWASSAKWAAIRAKMERDPNPSSRSPLLPNDLTLLQAAAGDGDLDMVKYLLETKEYLNFGAKKEGYLNYRGKSGKTALEHAELAGRQAVVDYLKSMGAR